MYYVLTDDEFVCTNICKSISNREKEYRIVNLFFPYLRGEKYVSIFEVNDDVELIILSADNSKRPGLFALLDDIGISRSLIFDFDKMYDYSIPKPHIDRMMQNKHNEKIEGVILGISHAEVGINTDYMKHNFVNFAKSHQDICYNLRALKYALSQYSDAFTNLKYAIIDLFDYYYFNYDTSRSSFAAAYVKLSGGVLGARNYDINSCMSLNYNELIQEITEEWYGNISADEVDIWNMLFGDYHENEQNRSTSNSINMGVLEEYDPSKFGFGGSAYNVYEKTVAENTAFLTELIETLKRINPNIKIAFVMLPRYIVAEESERSYQFMMQWKTIAYKIISGFTEKYGIPFHDFKIDDRFNHTLEYYYDASHFNLFGAAIFTNYIEQQIDSGELFEV